MIRRYLTAYSRMVDQHLRSNWGIVWLGVAVVLWTQMLAGHWPY